MEKCDNCDMDKRAKEQNTSIRNGTGTCSRCYAAKEKK
jgi:hypothetical protein